MRKFKVIQNTHLSPKRTEGVQGRKLVRNTIRKAKIPELKDM